MANSCIKGIKFSKDDYQKIVSAMSFGGDWEYIVNKIYQSEPIANSVIEAINDAVSVGKFDENWVPPEEIQSSSSEDPHPQINGAEVDREQDTIDLYYTDRKRGWSEQRKMVNKFVDDVLSRTLYDKQRGRYQRNQAQNINSRLYEYKLELLRNLWSVTGIDHESEITPETFNSVINQTILEFGDVSNTERADAYYIDYIILKRFNELLSKYTPFIKINPAYRNLDEHGVDMYYWDPSGKYRSNWTNKEDVDVEKITSPVVKILLDYFPTVSVNDVDLPKKIGFTTFNTVMSTILTWVHQNRTLNLNAKRIAEGIRREGLSYNFNNMIDVYIQENPSLNEGMKDVLRGIKKYIFSETSTMPLTLKQAFANQFFITAKYSYISYRLEYDSKGHKFDVSGKYLEDGFVDTKRSALMNLVKTRVRHLRNAIARNNSAFTRLCETNHIDIKDNSETGAIDIILDPEHYGSNVVISVSRLGDNINISDNGNIDALDSEAVVDLIQKTFQTFIPDNYQDIIFSMTANDVKSSNLFTLFKFPIAILYGAVFQTNEGIFDFDDETKELKTYLYKNRFNDAAHFQGIVSGVNELAVWKNGEGNNLPIFQLAPAIFDIFDIIDRFIANEDVDKLLEKLFYDELNVRLEDEVVKNVYRKNPYILYPEILRRIVARADAKVQGRVKSSSKMNVTEVASRAIFTDFYSNLMYSTDAKRSKTTNDELLHCILMQPITFSDKTTHYLPVTDLSKMTIDINLNGRNVTMSALEIYRELTKVGLEDKTRDAYLDGLTTSIREYQYDTAKNILFNQFLRFRNVFKDDNVNGEKLIDSRPGLTIDKFNSKLAFQQIVKVLDYVNSLDIKDRKDWIRRKFESANTKFNEDYDVRILKNGNLQANETLFYNIWTGTDNSIFNQHLDRAIRHFASNLGWYDIRIDLITDPQFRSYIEALSSQQTAKWVDSIAGIMKPFITYRLVDGVKIPVDFTVAEIDNGALFDPNIVIELNPIMQSYFYAHNMFSPAINDILFGTTGNYAPKNIISVDFNSVDPFDSRIEEMMAGALSMEFKRTTYAGAVKRKFSSVGVKFGVPEYIRFAGIDTSFRNISTIRGETHRQKTQDGNGWVDPILARMIQKSLIDSPVGDVRKTIAGWNDPTTGCQVNFKWAEDTITTYLRQRSEDVGSVEMMIRKGRRFDITEKFKKIKDFSIYYNPSKDAKKYSVAEEVLTHTDYIYRKNLDTGTYWRLDSVEINDGFLTGVWTRVDESGHVFENESPKKGEPVQITNLYELDKFFGGAWVFDLVDGNMVASEAVNDILYHIVCTNGMENDFVGYFVGREACKSGAFNWNPYSRLSDNDEELSTHQIRADGIGVLQNSDHELDFSEVTEMSQMMLLLTQTGDNIDLVNQMYEDIGRVANEALQSIILNLDKEKEIYRVLGKALMDGFNTRSRDELGIAQAFIRSAQATLESNGDVDSIILPYSAETIKGAFISTVTSMINKKGIRRKYAGFGGVEVGAEDTVVHYDVNGQHLTYEAVRDYYRPLLRKHKITWQQLRDDAYITKPNGETILNPAFVPVNQDEVGWGDTVFIRMDGDTTGGREIKITTQYEFDLVTALLRPVNSYPTGEWRGWEIYKWPTKSKQLEQSDLRWVSGGKKISEHNLDSVRASFYLDELMNYKKGKESHWGDEFDTNRKNVISAIITNDDIPAELRKAYEEETGNQFDISLLWTTNRYDNLIPELKKLLNHKTSEYLSKLSRIVKSEVAGTLPTQMIETYDFPEAGFVIETGELRPIRGMSKIPPVIEKRVAQIAMGRKNFDKFLLRKGDRLDKIKSRGWQFFYERLVEKQSSYNKIRHQINNFPYDAILNLSNGESILVAVGSKSSSQLHAAQDFVRSTEAIAYKGKVIIDNTLLKGVGDVSEIILNSIANSEDQNKPVPVITVKDFATLERLRKSSEVVHSSVRYTKGNWKDLIKTLNRNATINFAGVPIEVNADTVDTIEGDETINEIVRQLNVRERHYNRDRLKEKARLLYRNFIAQLNYIQTRIPSQAMQSTMALEVVDIVDTDTNYLWVPLITHLLQGSDLDIDKGYCMGYDIDDAGNIYSESDLIYDTTYEVDDVLLLDVPNYSVAQMISPAEQDIDPDAIRIHQNIIDDIINKGIINNWKKINYLRAFLKIMKPYAAKTVYFEMPVDKVNANVINDPYGDALEIARQAILDMNIHNSSVVDERKKAGALRNRVFAAARKIITDPASQMDHMLPVSLEEARSAASKSSLGKKEKSISIADPMTIFMMQQQNMSGKNVIALTATGIKSYFIITTHFNMIARDATRLIDELLTLPENSDRSNQIINEVAELFNQITFDSIFNPNGDSDRTLRTFANVNFKELREKLSDPLIRTRLNSLRLTKDIKTLPANELYKDYIAGGIFKLSNLIEHLDNISNGNTWIQKTDANGLPIWEYFVVNASDSLGSLLNAATDNAKELVLEKLNASEKFADYYIALLAMGYKFDDIADKMTTGAFRIVSRYAEDNIFDATTHKFDTNKAIGFVLNQNELPNITSGMFNSYLININDQHVDGQDFVGFLRQILDLNPLLNDTITLSDWMATKIRIPSDDDLSKINPNAFSNNKDRIITMAMANNYDWNRELLRCIYSLFNETSVNVTPNATLSEWMIMQLTNSLTNAVITYQNQSKSDKTSTDELQYQDYSNEPDPTDILNSGLPDEDIIDDISNVDDKTKWWRGNEYKTNDLIKLYRYAKLYFIPKTNLWLALSPEDRIVGEQLLTEIKDKIIYATKEIKMLGKIGSINQGMRVSDFDEYSTIENINKFINSAYVRRGNGEITEEFDLIKYLGDDKEYHDRHIKYYDKVKATVNILRAIDYTANFKEMFKYMALNRRLIERSVAVKLERALAKQALLEANNPKEVGGINEGLTKSFGRDEFRTLTHYTRDLIILNFFLSSDNTLRFSVPSGEESYEWIQGKYKLQKHSARNPKPMTLSTVDGLATFKHLMDWYVIPKLLEDTRPEIRNNKFIRNLSQEDVAVDVKSQKPISAYRLNIPIVNLSDPQQMDDYADLLYDFNRLLYQPIGEAYGIGSWTIGDLFFIYNLMTYKDRIGGNSMTRLFEDAISSNNRYGLPAMYYRYISALDRGINNIFDSNGIIDSNKFAYDISDLYYRLSDLDSSNWLFGITKDKPGKSVTEVYVPTEAIGMPVITDAELLSDFVFNMPKIMKIKDFRIKEPGEIYTKGFNKQFNTITASNEIVIRALIDELKNLYGDKVDINLVDEKQIERLFNDYDGLDKLLKSPGFIINGKMYLNLSKLSLDAPLHEFIHFVSAGMKFNSSQKIRDSYYEALDAVDVWWNTTDDKDLKQHLLDEYGNRVLSDRKEEVLATLLSLVFQKEFTESWGVKTIKSSLLQANIKKVWAEIFNSEKILNENSEDLANEKFRSILLSFASQLVPLTTNQISTSILLSHELADLKAVLYDRGYLKLDGCF